MERTKERQDLQLSVVVPVYNVEEYLEECLDSVEAAVQGIEAEVILVDDGSGDRSGEIARAYGERDPAFRYFYQENQGQSAARNFGVEKAAGKYLSFVDSDDKVTETYFRNMIDAAEYHGADMAIANTARFNSERVWRSKVHERAFSDIDKAVTCLRECGSLIYDTTVNRLIRRDLWEKHGFRFLEGYRFEDMLMALQLHLQANAVALVQEVGYLWRVREGEEKSTTQENAVKSNFLNRIEICRRMVQYVRENGDRKVMELLRSKILAHDMVLYMNKADVMTDQQCLEYRELMTEYLGELFEGEAFEELPILLRQKYSYFQAGEYDKLRAVIAYEKGNYKNEPVEEREGEYYIHLPEHIVELPERNLRNDIQTFVPKAHAADVLAAEEGILFQGYLYFPKISVRTPEELEIRGELWNIITGETVPLEIERYENKDLTSKKGLVFNGKDVLSGEYNYDGTGFTALVPASAELKKGVYSIHISYRHKVRAGSVFLRQKRIAISGYAEGLVFPMGELQMRVRHDAYEFLQVVVEERQEIPVPEDAAYLKEVVAEDSKIVLRVALPDGETESPLKLAFYDGLRKEDFLLAEGHATEEEKEAVFSVDFSGERIYNTLYTGTRPVYILAGEKKILLCADRRARAGVQPGDLLATFYCDNDRQMLLFSKSVWEEASNCNSKRRYNRRRLYEEFREEPVKETLILFEGEEGKSVRGKLRKLYLYVEKEHPEYTCVWSMRDVRKPFTGQAKRVRRKSLDYYHYLATARYIITDSKLEKFYVNRDGQKVINLSEKTAKSPQGLDAESPETIFRKAILSEEKPEAEKKKGFFSRLFSRDN